MQTYARLNDHGDVIEWPVFAHHIAARGETIDKYAPVTTPMPPHIDPIFVTLIEGWPVVNDQGKLVSVWEVRDRDIDSVRRCLFDRLAEIRWQHETSRITSGELSVAMDDKTVSRIAALAAKGSKCRWKTGPGAWVDLNVSAVRNLDKLIQKRLSNCFEAEFAVSELISNAGSLDDLRELELEAEFATALKT